MCFFFNWGGGGGGGKNWHNFIFNANVIPKILARSQNQCYWNGKTSIQIYCVTTG